MIAAAIVVLREVFEAALIVSIVLAATRSVARRALWVAGGIGLGILGALVVAAMAERISTALEGMGEELFNAGVLLVATVMLGGHNLWMRRHGAELSREMSSVASSVSAHARPLSVLLLVVALAVLREGSETVLFLFGIAAGGTARTPMLIGSLAGLLGGIGIGAALYFGLVQIPVRRLFAVTGILLLLLAAGMAAQGAGFLVQAGWLPPLADPLWDSSALLPEHGVIGQLLHALVGYAERPSGMQLVFFLLVLVVLGAAMRSATPRSVSTRAGTRIAGMLPVLLAGVCVFASRGAGAADSVYSPIVEQGEWALEYRGHRDRDSSRSRDGTAQQKLEIEYAPTAWWLTEVLTEWNKVPPEAQRATEVSWENVLQLTPQGKYWIDLGLLAEYARSLVSGSADTLELGLLLEKQLARSVITANLLGERGLVHGADTDLSYALRWRYRYTQAFEPGVEFYGSLGQWGRNPSLRSNEHSLGPSAFGTFRHATGRGAFHYETALLFALTRPAADRSFRLQLEYEL